MYKIAKILRRVLLKLPLPFLLGFGWLTGIVLYCNAKKRATAFRNIKLAFPSLPDHRLRRIARKSFIHFGISIVESFIASRIYTRVTLVMPRTPLSPDGGILVGIHEGSWELYNWLLARHFNYAIFARQQTNKGLDAFLNEVRSQEGLKVCFSLKELVKCLRNGYMAGLGVDHGAEDNALMIEFFSHLVPTPRGAVYLAKRLNKKIYPGFGYRAKGFTHVLKIGEPIETADKSEEELLRLLNMTYEQHLREHPHEYLWYYKRFKRKGNLDIVLLDDGKTGHFKQSRALEALIEEEKYIVRSKIITIRYRNKIFRILAEICAFFSTRQCFACGKCLKYLIDRNSYTQLMTSRADIVISTGSYAAAANRIFSSYIGAKSIAILRPNIPLSRFDLTILPRHDRIQSGNTAVIKGALFHAPEVDEKITLCKDFFNLTPEAKISVFFGGPLYDTQKFIENSKLFIAELKKYALAQNYRLLVSTSRRTPEVIDQYLARELEGFEKTETIVYARKANYDFVFEGFVSLSSMAFVSCESISMISEILQLKKPCVCLLLERADAKHKVFLESVRNEVTFLDVPYEMRDMKLKISSLFDENRRVIKEALKKVL
ncbi:MAG: ELM1/GtrOC1 family putative glycosyltransferase [Candidatus Omnitrophica bacterium]|nr:ELM1/GtrOC1 family putative glycosyltransferase [Candidatus Omnitrophota bacterium]